MHIKCVPFGVVPYKSRVYTFSFLLKWIVIILPQRVEPHCHMCLLVIGAEKMAFAYENLILSLRQTMMAFGWVCESHLTHEKRL